MAARVSDLLHRVWRPAPAPSAARPPRRRWLGPRWRRNGLIALGAAVVIAAGAYVALRPSAAPASATNDTSVHLAAVMQGTLTSQQQLNGTVGYADSYTVANQQSGTYTALPQIGDVVKQGRPLYSVDGQAVVLLNGNTPAYRTLYAGMIGPDVAELNADLTALGYDKGNPIPKGSDTFTAATAAALDRLQSHLGLRVTGELPFGEAVFLPGSVNISSVTPSTGGKASAGQTVVQANSTALQVSAQIDAAQQSEVHVGDPASITMPDGSIQPGKVTKVAQVATTPSSSGSGSSGAAPSTSSQVEVDIAPSKSAAFHGLYNAVLNVAITTASVKDALSVPVTALLAQTGGGYAVEVVRPDGKRNVVPVHLGVFDDGEGLVQVTGTGLKAGDQVVVAGT